MNPAAILGRFTERGVTARVERDAILLRPFSKVPRSLEVSWKGDQMEALRFEVVWAVIQAMHFDTPEGESTPGEYIDLGSQA